MNELAKVVADLVLKATQAAEAAGRFAVEQLPDIARQYVLFVGIWNTLTVLSLLGVTGVMVYLTKKQFDWIGRWVRENSYSMNERADTLFFSAIVWGVYILWAHQIFAVAARLMVLAFFAPKILLLEWAASLVK